MITDAVRKEILRVSVELSLAALATSYPPFGLVYNIPGVKSLINLLIEYMLGPLFEQMQKYVNFTEIDIQDQAQAAAADSAKKELEKVLNDSNKTQQEIDSARADFRAKYAAAISMRKS